jgi:hypothetical protein
LLVVGLVCIWVVPLLTPGWIYDRVANRAAFTGQAGGPPPGVTVKSIEKPSTVTFSNGVVAAVGYLPAGAMEAFHLVVSVVGSGLYIYKFRRPIRRLVNETSPRAVTRRGAA